jgi:hypothetical protein
MKRFRTLALAGCLLATSGAAAQTSSSEGPKARATALTRDGARAYQAGNYAAALTRFQEAYAVFPSPRLLFNLGQCYGRVDRYVEATESYERFLASAGNAPASARTEAERSLEQMRDKVAHLEVAANVAAAEVWIDGQSRGLTPLPRPVLVATGAHQVLVRKAGAEPFERRLEVVGGTLARIDAELRFPPPAPPPPAAVVAPATPPTLVLAAPAALAPAGWSWSERIGLSLLVVGPAVMGTGLYYGKRARDRAGDIARYCQPGCAGRDILPSDQTRRRDGLTQWLLLGTGAAATATGAALFFLGGETRPTETRLSLVWSPAGLSAGLARRF